MNRTFICKDGASNFYMQHRLNGGMGGFLNPPGDAEHSYSIDEMRGGHVTGCMSLRTAVETDWVPDEVKRAAQAKLDSMKGDVKNEAWIASVYNYYRNCYSPDGVNRSAGDCVVDATNQMPPTSHLAYLRIKEFDLDHEPNLELIARSGAAGRWHKGD